MPNEIMLIDRMIRSVMQVKDLSKAVDFTAQAKAMRGYFKRVGAARELQNKAAHAAALGEARCGQILAETPRKKRFVNSPSLGELGLDRHDSARLKAFAAIMDHDPGWFERYRDECTALGKDFTQHASIRRGTEILNERTGKRKVKAPRGKYDVIVIDPPWPMVKYERDDRPNQAGFDYPTMVESELEELGIPCADDCHVWLWTTHKFLPMALRLLVAWDLKYTCLFTWKKKNAIQPFNMPKLNSEFLIYARRGAPKFVDLKDFWCCFEAPRGAHSEKPKEFYDMVRRVTDGKRLDMFARKKHIGFRSWGNEAV